MLALVYPLKPNTAQRVRERARARWVREQRVRGERRHRARREPEPERAQPAEGVERPDDAVVVPVEERAVLLEHGRVRVRGRPPRRAGGALGGGCGVRAGGSWASMCVHARCGAAQGRD